MRADVLGDSLKALACFIDRSSDGCREHRRGAVAGDRGGDAVQGGGVRLHNVMSARAMDMHVHKAGNDGHAGGDVVSGALRDFDLVAMTNCGDAAAFDDNNGVEELFLRSKDAAGVNGSDGHRIRIVLELHSKDISEPCIIFLLRYNQLSPISRRVLNGKRKAVCGPEAAAPPPKGR